MRAALMVDPFCKVVEKTSLELARLPESKRSELKAYAARGAVIHFSTDPQPCGNDSSQSGWSVSGAKFVAHGRAIIIGNIRAEEITFE